MINLHMSGGAFGVIMITSKAPRATAVIVIHVPLRKQTYCLTPTDA